MWTPILWWAPGIWEIGAIVLLAGLLFGGKKIPELMKGIGTGIKEFKKASTGEETPEQNMLNDPNKK